METVAFARRTALPIAFVFGAQRHGDDVPDAGGPRRTGRANPPRCPAGLRGPGDSSSLSRPYRAAAIGSSMSISPEPAATTSRWSPSIDPLQQDGDPFHQDDIGQAVAGELEEVGVGLGDPHVRADPVEQHQLLVDAGQLDADGLDLLFRSNRRLEVPGRQPEHLLEMLDVRRAARVAGGLPDRVRAHARRIAVARRHGRPEQRHADQQTRIRQLPDRNVGALVPLLGRAGENAPARLQETVGVALEATAVDPHDDREPSAAHHGEIDAEAGDPFPEFLQVPSLRRIQRRSRYVRHEHFHAFTYLHTVSIVGGLSI